MASKVSRSPLPPPQPIPQSPFGDCAAELAELPLPVDRVEPRREGVAAAARVAVAMSALDRNGAGVDEPGGDGKVAARRVRAPAQNSALQPSRPASPPGFDEAPSAAPARTSLGYRPPPSSSTEAVAAPPSSEWAFEAFKPSGRLGVLRFDLSRGYVTFGRSPDADVTLEHPSCSRLHAVLEFRASDGLPRLLDAGSTHGTRVNRRRLEPRAAVRVRVGDVIAFGASSRFYVLLGPEQDRPAEAKKRDAQGRTKEGSVGEAHGPGSGGGGDGDGTGGASVAAVAAGDASAVSEKRHAPGVPLSSVALWSGRSAEASQRLPTGDGHREEASGATGTASPSPPSHQTSPAVSAAFPFQPSERQLHLAQRIRRLRERADSLRASSRAIRARAELSRAGFTPGQAAAILQNDESVKRLCEEADEAEEVLRASLGRARKGRRIADDGADDREAGAGPATARGTTKAHDGLDPSSVGRSSASHSKDDGERLRRQRGSGPAATSGRDEPSSLLLDLSVSLVPPPDASPDAAELEARRRIAQERVDALEGELRNVESSAHERQGSTGRANEDAGEALSGRRGDPTTTDTPGAKQGEATAKASAARQERVPSLDALDAFMAESLPQQLARDESDRITRHLVRAKKDVRTLGKLLQVADPEGIFARERAEGGAISREEAERAVQRARSTLEGRADEADATTTRCDENTQGSKPSEQGDFDGGNATKKAPLPLPQAALCKATPASAPSRSETASELAVSPGSSSKPSEQDDAKRRRVQGPSLPLAPARASPSPTPQLRSPQPQVPSRTLPVTSPAPPASAPDQSTASTSAPVPPAPLPRASTAPPPPAYDEGDWQPPEGQSGDGRTALNDALGY